MECTTESCGTHKDEACVCGSEKPYDQCCGCETMDPVQQSIAAWHKAFFTALHQSQTERLKKKIESSFGPILDKEADAVFEAIGKMWSSMLTQSEAKKEVASKLQKIFSEANRR